MNVSGSRHGIRVLIVDDHDAFLTVARKLLEQEGFDVVGVAVDGSTAVSEAARLCPDLVLLDVQLPDFDGFEVARRLASVASPPAVVLTSTRSAADYGARVHEGPVCGFIPKEELSGERLLLVAGLDAPAPAPAVDGGALPISPAVTS